MKTLVQLCQEILLRPSHITRITSTGSLPHHLIAPLLAAVSSPAQLRQIEESATYELAVYNEELWKEFCKGFISQRILIEDQVDYFPTDVKGERVNWRDQFVLEEELQAIKLKSCEDKLRTARAENLLAKRSIGRVDGVKLAKKNKRPRLVSIHQPKTLIEKARQSAARSAQVFAPRRRDSLNPSSFDRRPLPTPSVSISVTTPALTVDVFAGRKKELNGVSRVYTKPKITKTSIPLPPPPVVINPTTMPRKILPLPAPPPTVSASASPAKVIQRGGSSKKSSIFLPKSKVQR